MTSTFRKNQYQRPEYRGTNQTGPSEPQLTPGTRIRILNRARKYYGEEYQGELTISVHETDDYGRVFYLFVEHPGSKAYLYEFQVEHEFEILGDPS